MPVALLIQSVSRLSPFWVTVMTKRRLSGEYCVSRRRESVRESGSWLNSIRYPMIPAVSWPSTKNWKLFSRGSGPVCAGRIEAN